MKIMITQNRDMMKIADGISLIRIWKSMIALSLSGWCKQCMHLHLSIYISPIRNRNLGISRAPLKSQARQGTSLFTSANLHDSNWPLRNMVCFWICE